MEAGNNIHLDTDTLEAKKDMTENSDNYIRIEAVGGAMVGDRSKDWAKGKIPTDQDIQLTKGSGKRK